MKKKLFAKLSDELWSPPEDYCFLAMLPSYLESSRSSLVYMVGKLIETSKNLNSRFYKDNFNEIAEALTQLDQKGQKNDAFRC